jgi:phytoene desaturase
MGKNNIDTKRVEGKKVVIIGGGIGGLATAGILAKAGAHVTLLEKNDHVGGRASVFEAEGFRFDMGPSWYLMPDIFEQFFHLMGTSADKELNLVKLSPSYRIYAEDRDGHIDITGDKEQDIQLIESLEEGAGEKLRTYLKRSKEQYEIAKNRFIYKNYDSIFDFFTPEVARAGMKLSVFSTMHTHVRKWFKSDLVQKIMQYPLVFLGASPYNAPAIYNIMSHIDFDMGVYYPMGGMYELIKALKRIAEDAGATLNVNKPVKTILIENGKATGVLLEDNTVIEADIIVNNTDPAFTDLNLLPTQHQYKSKRYWENRTLAPSGFILYLGFKKKLKNLQHHTLFFSKDWEQNFSEIFDKPQLPTMPSYYICAPSLHDASVAPEGKENLFILVPIASKLELTEKDKEAYKQKILTHLGGLIDEEDLSEHIEYSRTFTVEDFKDRYNSYGGTALGLAHTLWQTAIFRPDTVHPKIKNLFYVGGNTNPGIGMPMCLISAQLVYKRLIGDKTSGPLESI